MNISCPDSVPSAHLQSFGSQQSLSILIISLLLNDPCKQVHLGLLWDLLKDFLANVIVLKNTIYRKPYEELFSYRVF